MCPPRTKFDQGLLVVPLKDGFLKLEFLSFNANLLCINYPLGLISLSPLWYLGMRMDVNMKLMFLVSNKILCLWLRSLVFPTSIHEMWQAKITDSLPFLPYKKIQGNTEKYMVQISVPGIITKWTLLCHQHQIKEKNIASITEDPFMTPQLVPS
jgi:hypothetical protein